jgi:hypothetical protein
MTAGPLPLRDRIKGALRLEPMAEPELARILCHPIDLIAAELEMMRVRGEVRRLTGSWEWMNLRASMRIPVAA